MAIPYQQFVGEQDALSLVRDTLPRIVAACGALTPSAIAAPIAPGKWSVHEIIAHLADSELAFQNRARLILFEDTPHLVPFDQDRWLNGWRREGETFAQTLERFRVLRESTIRLYANAPAEDLTRFGMHDERGQQSAGDYLILIAGHTMHHVLQIEAYATAAV